MFSEMFYIQPLSVLDVFHLLHKICTLLFPTFSGPRRLTQLELISWNSPSFFDFPLHLANDSHWQEVRGQEVSGIFSLQPTLFLAGVGDVPLMKALFLSVALSSNLSYHYSYLEFPQPFGATGLLGLIAFRCFSSYSFLQTWPHPCGKSLHETQLNNPT